jgi:transcription elongation factor GreB
VTVDSNEGEQRYCIVGEDEADAEQHRVSYLSPLAQALLGAHAGDEVSWKRPAGDLVIEVVAIDYTCEIDD